MKTAKLKIKLGKVPNDIRCFLDVDGEKYNIPIKAVNINAGINKLTEISLLGHLEGGECEIEVYYDEDIGHILKKK
jgi:hypothetical protein